MVETKGFCIEHCSGGDAKTLEGIARESDWESGYSASGL